MRTRNLNRIHLSCYIGTYPESAAQIGVCFTPKWGEAGIHGKDIPEVLKQYDDEHSPEARLTRAKSLRAEADAIEASVAGAAPFTIADETKIQIVEENHTLTWRELVLANSDSGESEIERWKRDLAQKGEAKIGGGAAAAFTLKLAA